MLSYLRASRYGPVHVVRNVRKHGDKEYESFLLRRSVRVGKKLQKQTLANLSHLPIELIDIIRRFLAERDVVGSRKSLRIDLAKPENESQPSRDPGLQMKPGTIP